MTPRAAPTPEVAQSIETTDNVNYRIILKPGWTFTDGSPVTAHSFVDAWNYGALSTNAQLQQSFFSPIDGFDDGRRHGDGKPTATTMSGLQVINDQEFTVRLKAPTIDFKLRLGLAPSIRCRRLRFRDMAAFGQHPIGNGPYNSPTSPDGPAWEHNVRIDLGPNPDYHGNRVPQNKGLRFEFYANLDTAYADLLSGNLDVLDTIPSSALTIYRRDLGGQRGQRDPSRRARSLDTPLRLPHFGGEEGRLRRLALSAAINRAADLSADLQRHPQPGSRLHREFAAGIRPRTSPATTRWTSIPDRARRLWSQANAISPWSGRYAIAYNADSGPSGVGRRGGQQHQERAGHRRRRCAAAHLRGVSHPDHQPHDRHRVPRRLDRRLPVDARVPRSVVRHRRGHPTTSDTPTASSTPRLAAAEAAPDLPQSYVLANVAQRILLHDMPVVPLWYYHRRGRVVTGGQRTSRSPGTDCPTTNTS